MAGLGYHDKEDLNTASQIFQEKQHVRLIMHSHEPDVARRVSSQGPLPADNVASPASHGPASVQLMPGLTASIQRGQQRQHELQLPQQDDQI